MYEWFLQELETAHWCKMTISVPLGVWQFPVENVSGVIKNKRCKPKKVNIIWHLQIDTLPTGVYPLWTYLFKTWSCKSGFWADLVDAKIKYFNFKNEKSHVDKIYSFQLFVDFSTDSKSPAIKFLNLVLNIHICLYKDFVFVWKIDF